MNMVFHNPIPTLMLTTKRDISEKSRIVWEDVYACAIVPSRPNLNFSTRRLQLQKDHAG